MFRKKLKRDYMNRRERKANLGFMFMKSNYFAREKIK